MKSMKSFTFETGTKVPEMIKIKFINNEFLSLYYELRNLKKLI